jgi:hypothetical protein
MYPHGPTSPPHIFRARILSEVRIRRQASGTLFQSLYSKVTIPLYEQG